MQFIFNDAWLLHSIHVNEKAGLGAELLDIINYCDYINHAVLEYAELTGSLARLLPAGLVLQLGHKLATTKRYTDWWEEKYAGRKRIDVHQALRDLQLFLNDNFANLELPDPPAAINISAGDFAAVINLYKGV